MYEPFSDKLQSNCLQIWREEIINCRIWIFLHIDTIVETSFFSRKASSLLAFPENKKKQRKIKKNRRKERERIKESERNKGRKEEKGRTKEGQKTENGQRKEENKKTIREERIRERQK